jgi:gamma-glutamyltranspeptidase/glutathione hydrolase
MNGRRAAVVAGHPEAAQAGIRMLESGGNVADAAIAASAALCVTMPHATTLGGDAFILIRDGRTGRISGLNASGTAPHSPECARLQTALPMRGALAPVVPGLVRGWHDLHERFGAAPWERLHEHAIALADGGFPISNSLKRTLDLSAPVLLADPGCAAAFFDGNRPLSAGDVLRQPALAATLAAIAAGGAEAFYEGPVGERLVSYIEQMGGILSRDDLRRFATRWETPLSTRYRGHDVWAMPPNSYGVLMLMQFNALQALPPDALCVDPVARMRWQVRAMRASFHQGFEQIGDPEAMTIDARRLLDEGPVARTRQLMFEGINDPPRQAGAGTACVLIADATGNAACIVQSIFNPFGSHFMDPGTGILLNNRMYGFLPGAGGINSLAPGKRSPHTLNPVMIEKEGALRWVYASPGGMSQTVMGVQVAVNLIDRGLSNREALDEGRWALDRKGKLYLEPDASPEFVEALAVAGVEAARIDDNYIFGSAKLIEAGEDGTLHAVADRRRDACAIAI